MITGLLLGSIAYALYRMHAGTDGVGKIRRNIYAEIEHAQKNGVNLSMKYADQRNIDSLLQYMMQHYRWSPSRTSGKRPEEQYYNSLRNVYRKLAGNVGAMPGTEHVIHNQRGDVIMVYTHYDIEKDLQNAKDLYSSAFSATSDSYDRGYAATVLWIANGGKFLWKDKGTKRGLESELFGRQAPEERKRYGWILSTKGRSVDEMAEAASGYDGDSLDVRNGVLDAVRDFSSQKDANDYILNQYYDFVEKEQGYSAEYYDDPENEEWERNYDRADYVDAFDERIRNYAENQPEQERWDNMVLPF